MFKDTEQRERKYDARTVSIRRVSKVTGGGKRLRVSALVVVGDKNGSVGIALGRGADTKSAVDKGIRRAERNIKKIELIGDTIPHEITIKNGASKVLLRPARTGTGIIAGSSARTVLEVCGVDNVYAKILGSNDLIANAYSVYEALTQLRSGRVLKRMKNMQARIGIKEEMDKEKRKRDALKRKNKKEDYKKKGGFRRDYRRAPRAQSRVDSRPVQSGGAAPVVSQPSAEKKSE